MLSADNAWLKRCEDFEQSVLRYKSVRFSRFVTPHELAVFRTRFSPSPFVSVLAFGGADDCERMQIGFFPDFEEPNRDAFPITPISISGVSGLTHRDILGAVLGLGIKREMTGDIFVDGDTAVLMSDRGISDFLLCNLKTVGRKKVEVMKEHMLEINPAVAVEAYDCFFLPETRAQFDFAKYDYVIDAVDTVTAKIALVEACQEAGVPIVSSMGAGNKLDPTAFEVADIYKTSVCPLAKVMRRELKKRNIKHLKVVYSKEEALEPIEDDAFVSDEKRQRRATPGSVAFVPSVAGLILAGEVVKDLSGARG